MRHAGNHDVTLRVFPQPAHGLAVTRARGAPLGLAALAPGYLICSSGGLWHMHSHLAVFSRRRRLGSDRIAVRTYGVRLTVSRSRS